MKTLDDYTVVVAPDSNAYLAYAPAIKGCYALGETPDAARSELTFGLRVQVKDVVRQHLQLARRPFDSPQVNNPR